MQLRFPKRTYVLPEFHIRMLVWPLLVVVPLWVVYYLEIQGVSMPSQGLHPERAHRWVDGLWYPLLHADLKHLLNNSIPSYVLIALGAYFYRYLMPWVIFAAWIFSAWFLIIYGRPSYHLGFSGIVYSMAYFLFFSGLIRRHPRLLAVSLIVAFLYGSMVWGIFPLEERISWEGHLGGAIAGALCAIALYPFGLHRPPSYSDDEIPDWWYEAHGIPKPSERSSSDAAEGDQGMGVGSEDHASTLPNRKESSYWTQTHTGYSVKRGSDGKT